MQQEQSNSNIVIYQHSTQSNNQQINLTQRMDIQYPFSINQNYSSSSSSQDFQKWGLPIQLSNQEQPSNKSQPLVFYFKQINDLWQQSMSNCEKCVKAIQKIGCGNKQQNIYYLYFTHDPEDWRWQKVQGNKNISFKYSAAPHWNKTFKYNADKPICGKQSVLCRPCWNKLIIKDMFPNRHRLY